MRELEVITLRNQGPSVSLTWLLYNLRLDDVLSADFENSLYALGQSEKR